MLIDRSREWVLNRIFKNTHWNLKATKYVVFQQIVKLEHFLQFL